MKVKDNFLLREAVDHCKIIMIIKEKYNDDGVYHSNIIAIKNNLTDETKYFKKEKLRRRYSTPSQDYIRCIFPMCMKGKLDKRCLL